MTYIAPCTRCPISAGCVMREEIRRKVRGLGASSVRFKCSFLADALRVGRRIMISIPVLVENGGSYSDAEVVIMRQHVSATITAHNGKYQFMCLVDRDVIPLDYGQDESDGTEHKRRRRWQTHSRVIQFLDEPDRTVCANGAVVSDGECDNAANRCQCKFDAEGIGQ